MGGLRRRVWGLGRKLKAVGIGNWELGLRLALFKVWGVRSGV